MSKDIRYKFKVNCEHHNTVVQHENENEEHNPLPWSGLFPEGDYWYSIDTSRFECKGMNEYFRNFEFQVAEYVEDPDEVFGKELEKCTNSWEFIWNT